VSDHGVRVAVQCCDRRRFVRDHITLTQHWGVHMLGDMVAVLCAHSQTAHILQIKARTRPPGHQDSARARRRPCNVGGAAPQSSGMLVDVRTLGPHCYEDDEWVLACAAAAATAAAGPTAAALAAGAVASHPPLRPPAPVAPMFRTGHGRPALLRRAVRTGAELLPWEDMDLDGAGAAPAPALAPAPMPLAGAATAAGAVAPWWQRDAVGPARVAMAAGDPGVRPLPQEDGVGGAGAAAGAPAATGASGRLTGLRQRFLAYMYRRAVADADPRRALRQFHYNYAQLEAMVMVRLQFLDRAHLLIKYGHASLLTARVRRACWRGSACAQR
jgi:hypothetical protein